MEQNKFKSNIQTQIDTIKICSDYDISVYIQDKYLECRKNIRKLPLDQFVTLSLYLDEWELRIKRGIAVEEPKIDWIAVIEEEKNREKFSCPNIKLLRWKFDMEVEEEEDGKGGATKKHKMKLKSKGKNNGRKTI